MCKNSSDAVSESHKVILECLYDNHKNAKTNEDLKLGIRQLAKDVKSQLTKEEVIHCLDYLIDAGYVTVDCDKFTTPKGVVKDTNIKYKISSLGITMLEDPGVYRPRENFISGINIQQVESVVILNKNGPILINQKYAEVGSVIEELKSEISLLDSMPIQRRQEILSLISSLEGLLLTSEPEVSILEKICDKLREKLSSIPSEMASDLIKSLMSSIVTKLFG